MRIIDVLKSVVVFILLILLQVLVLNNIPFLGIAIGFPYIYFIIKQPIEINRNLLLLIGFVLGFTIDIFSNTPGIHAAATTLISFFRRGIQGLFFSREDFEHEIPQFEVLKGVFVKYTLTMILVHHTVLICLESFSYSSILMMGAKILGSVVLTFIIIMGIELLFDRKSGE